MCGIFGIIKEKPSKFDYTTFCTLGIYNDTRGGDSCGIFIDGKYEYGTGNTNKYFELFMIPEGNGSKLLQETTTSTITIGHCRKASVGRVIDETTAQPVILKEDDKITYVLMHNGTIHNYKELAKKYIPDIDIIGMTDSQVMARIFYYKGYDALNEYYGGATFFILDYRFGDYPKVLMFRGCSKKTTYSASKEQERGLHLAVSDGELVFSSESKYLPALRKDAYHCYPTDNMLVEWDGKKLVAGKVYPRDNVTQAAPVTTGTSSNVCNPAVSIMPNTHNTSPNTKSTKLYINNPSNDNVWVSNNTSDGRCRAQDQLLHGMLKVSNYGRIVNNTDENTLYQCIWFWAGFMLKNYECYKFLDELALETDCTPVDLTEIYPELILYLSPYPYYKDKNFMLYKVNSALTGEPFTGDMYWPFNSTCYSYSNGRFNGSSVKTMIDSMHSFNKHKDDKIDFTEFVDLV